MSGAQSGVCLTGDVHHRTMGGRDQRLARRAEAELARDYLAIAGDAQLRPTLFLTGKVVEQDQAIVQRYSDLAQCELGGHGYRALTPWAFHFGLVRRFTGSPWINATHQRRDINQTIKAFEASLGTSPTSWRDHSYAGDNNTPGLLRNAGVKVLSDKRDLHALRPTADQTGIVIAAINTSPDHEHIEHPRGSGGPGTTDPREWLSAVLGQVAMIVGKNGIAILIVHPVCMHLADDFETFKRLCIGLRDYPSVQLSELDATTPTLV